MDNRAKIVITFETLKELLRLPEDAEIYGIQMTPEDLSKSQCEIFIKHPDLPRWNEAMVVPRINIVYKKSYYPIIEFDKFSE